MHKRDERHLKNAIRKISRFSKAASNVRKRAKVYEEIGTIKTGKNKGKPKYKLLGSRCNFCKQLFEKIEVDHVIEIGKMPRLPDGQVDWNKWINRVICDEEELQALCADCHKEKTRGYNQNGAASGEYYL